MSKIHKGLVQMSMEREPSRNLVKAGILVEGVTNICLPELYATKYFFADHRRHDEDWLDTATCTTGSFRSEVGRRAVK